MYPSIKDKTLLISMVIVFVVSFIILLNNIQNTQNRDDNFRQNVENIELKINQLICDNETPLNDQCKKAFEVFKNTFGHEDISKISNERLIKLYDAALMLYLSDIEEYKHLGRISIKEVQQAILIRMDDIAGRVRREKNRREKDWLILINENCN